MALITQRSRWDDTGTTIPPGDAVYAVNEQPVAEYDNKHNSDTSLDLTDVISELNTGAIGTKNVVIKVIPDAVALTTGDGKAHFTVPIELNGMNLVTVGAHVYTVSSSGTPTFQIHNLTDAVDILSTVITIDANEKDSSTAVTPAVINAANDDVATGDELRFDCDVQGTGAAGFELRMGFRSP